jgi:hypothetical protein
MTFGDLKGMVGQTIVYYVVKGCIIKAKKGKVSWGRDYYRNGDSLDLKLVDKLGRCQGYVCHTIYFGNGYYNRGVNVSKSTVYDCGYAKLYLNKEEAYRYVIEKLRKQRQDINKRMLKAQMELYGKKMEISNEG